MEQINNYIEHLHDVGYIEGLMAGWGQEGTLAAIESMLERHDEEEVYNALTFLRDAVIVAKQDELLVTLEASSCWKTLTDMLYCDNHFIRMHVVYTIGKLSQNAHSTHLASAFEHYLDKDPILLNSLLFELQWLEEPIDGLAQQMLESPYVSVQLVAMKYEDKLSLDRDLPQYPIDFFFVELGFSSKLRAEDKVDYTIEEMEAYVQEHL